jgi:hypothetical protein
MGESSFSVQHRGLHLLRLVHDEDRPEERRVDVRLPLLAQCLRAGPAVVGRQRHAEEVTQLAVEVGDAALRPGEQRHLHVAQRREALDEEPQGGTLAAAGLPGGEREVRTRRVRLLGADSPQGAGTTR